MKTSNQKKQMQLGMPGGTANGILRKSIMFSMMVALGLNECFQCGETIENVDSLSIEHKEPWLDSDNPKERFFDLSNIAFSHLSCNVRAARKPNRGRKVVHGSKSTYDNIGCRCGLCKAAQTKYRREYRGRQKLREYDRLVMY